MIQVTPAAVKEVTRMLQNQTPYDPEAGLRLAVKGGGCSGLSYDMAFDKQKPGDQQFTYEGLKVYVDPKSFLYLDGMTFDYADTLKDKGFKFINPNASKTCGCGESFAV